MKFTKREKFLLMRGYAMTTFENPLSQINFLELLTNFNHDFELNLTLKELEEFEKEAKIESNIWIEKAQKILKGHSTTQIRLKEDQDYR